jgi:CubicO group peptidase (beta-lactamase class C family)
VLRTYNSDSPHVRLADWGGTECYNCGCTVDDDDRVYCEEAVQLAEQAFLAEFAKLVSHLTERLQGGQGEERRIFRDSLLGNLTEFFDKFRHLNVGSSHELDRLVEQAQRLVQRHHRPGGQAWTAAENVTYPDNDWKRRAPEEVGLVAEKLRALARLVGGRGCVVRHGYLVFTWGDASKSSDIASAVKPIISTLLFLAIQQGLLQNVDAKVADFEPRLRNLNHGKDADITWRHLASQTSGYGLTEAPGAAYSYNDFALALYYDTLVNKVYKQDGTRVLKERLGDVLGFQDRYTFEGLGPKWPGRLAISPRDFARFGLLYLRGGKWKERQVLDPSLVRLALHSPVPSNTPLTGGRYAEMLPGQRSHGGSRNITPVGPGYYSFNWWLNRTDKKGRRLFVDAPPDTFVASGHGGKRALWVIPSLDLILAWNDATVEDHDASPGNPQTKCNQAMRLMREAVRPETRRPRRPTVPTAPPGQ